MASINSLINVTLKSNVAHKEYKDFEMTYFEIAGFMRKAIIERDREILQKYDSYLSDFLSWYYMPGKARWTQVIKQIGSLEMAYDIIQDLLNLDKDKTITLN